jgi:hypothetical protein
LIVVLFAITSAEIAVETVVVGTGANQAGSNTFNWEPCRAAKPLSLSLKSPFGSCDSLTSSKSDTKNINSAFSAAR